MFCFQSSHFAIEEMLVKTKSRKTKTQIRDSSLSVIAETAVMLDLIAYFSQKRDNFRVE